MSLVKLEGEHMYDKGGVTSKRAFLALLI